MIDVEIRFNNKFILLMKKSVIISGITGQIGSYFAEFLLDRGYEVHGLIRRSSSFNTGRINHIYDNSYLKLHYSDLSDALSIYSLISDIKPSLFINEAAMSHVAVSFGNPEYTFDINATGVVRCLEAIRKSSPGTRFLQASTSELYGSTPAPQNEGSAFHPRSPYAVSKLAAYWATVNYREAYGIHASNSITFNSESYRRGQTFVTKKITRAATRIKLGLQNELRLGNLSAKRSWTHVLDQIEARYRIIMADEPDDYVVGMEESHSVQEFLELVFSKLDLDYKQYVIIDPKYFRPAEVDHLEPNCKKIRERLGWEPKISFDQLVQEMVDSDLELAKKELLLR